MKTYFIPFISILIALTLSLSSCGKQTTEKEIQEEKTEQQEKKPESKQTSMEQTTLSKPKANEKQTEKEEEQEKSTPVTSEQTTLKQIVKEQQENQPEKRETVQPVQQKEAAVQEKTLPSSQNKQKEVVSVKAEKPVQKERATKPVSPPAPAKPAEQKPAEQKVEIVSISIKGDDEHGTILSSVNVEMKEGDSVLDVLKKVTKEKRIQLDYSGAGAAAYIEGIDNLYEFDRGPTSGWMFKVNGTFVQKSAGAVNVKNGDRIEWVYTTDLGKDVGAKQ